MRAQRLSGRSSLRGECGAAVINVSRATFQTRRHVPIKLVLKAGAGRGRLPSAHLTVEHEGDAHRAVRLRQMVQAESVYTSPVSYTI